MDRTIGGVTAKQSKCEVYVVIRWWARASTCSTLAVSSTESMCPSWRSVPCWACSTCHSVIAIINGSSNNNEVIAVPW